MKYLSKFGILIFLILILIGICMQIKNKESSKVFFDLFNSTGFDSKIEEVQVIKKGVKVKLVNGQAFLFYPYTDEFLNDNRIFDYTAKKGDRIIKEAYNDTLFLLQGDLKLAYKFSKF